jgi:hypothetical protein
MLCYDLDLDIDYWLWALGYWLLAVGQKQIAKGQQPKQKNSIFAASSIIVTL